MSTALPIRILGVNAPELSAGNAEMCAGRTLAWLQDTKPPDTWNLWQVDFRDVIVIDGENRVVAIYNLTSHDLGDSTNYAALRNILLTAAGTSLGTARFTFR